MAHVNPKPRLGRGRASEAELRRPRSGPFSGDASRVGARSEKQHNSRGWLPKFSSTIVLSEHPPFSPGFWRFSRKKDPWKEWGRYP